MAITCRVEISANPSRPWFARLAESPCVRAPPLAWLTPRPIAFRRPPTFADGAYGFVAGLPLPLSGFTFRLWLSEGGASLETIGLTTSIGLAYSLKFFWAPLLDNAPPPVAARSRAATGLAAGNPATADCCCDVAGAVQPSCGAHPGGRRGGAGGVPVRQPGHCG